MPEAKSTRKLLLIINLMFVGLAVLLVVINKIYSLEFATIALAAICSVFFMGLIGAATCCLKLKKQ